MVSTRRGAARQTPAARRSTKQPPLKRRRAASDAPAAGTAEDPIKADSSSEYDSTSDGEGVETRPCRPAERPKKRAAATRERPKNKKTRTGGGTAIYGWHELNTDITDEVRGVLNAMDPETAALCQDAAAHATYELDTDGSPLRVHTPPKFLEALYARFEEIGRDVEVKVQGPCQIKFHAPDAVDAMWPSQVKSYGLDASQPRITSLAQLLETPLFHIMCYDPKSKNHPLDGMTLYDNISVEKVMGKHSFLARCLARGKIKGDVRQATALCRVVDAFCAQMASRDGGDGTKPAAKFIELCGGDEEAKTLLELYVKRVKLMFRIWELAHGRLPTVVSRVESDVASMARWRDHVVPRRSCRGVRTPWRWSRRSAPVFTRSPITCIRTLAYSRIAVWPS